MSPRRVVLSTIHPTTLARERKAIALNTKVSDHHQPWTLNDISSMKYLVDHNTAIHNAKEHHDGSGDSDLFSSALSFLKDNKVIHER
jgi:hypothetical protein